MPTATHLNAFKSSDLKSYLKPRTGETKLGQELRLLDNPDAIKDLAALRQALLKSAASGVRFVILGVPEDIGPRANLGRAGSDEAWSAFISAFVNIQANEFIAANNILLLGDVGLNDLQKESAALDVKNSAELDKLRQLCATIDARVAPIIHQIIAAGLEPIVIGGGHNNTYPIQQGLTAAQREAGTSVGVACINCDPHADFRAPEGRHSGNGFTYAYNDGLLKAYYVLGLHEVYNSQAILESLRKAGFQYSTYEDAKVRCKISWPDAISRGIDYLTAHRNELPVGIELDLDSIAFLPVSAETPNGLRGEEALHYIYRVASAFKNLAYLHIPEGVPRLHASPQIGARYVGRTIVGAVAAYIKARKERS